ncbi:MAG: 3-methyl-2-oxobutanoate dehydrogenase subunit VorB [Sphaerochaetaceae bacterium]
MARELMKGNDAVAEAAVRAGCRFFAGYPITPQSEILEYLSWRLPEVGGVFVQTESELSGISMVYGAAATGARTFTSSSGPGFSLMQEGISYIASAELPCVVVDVQRYGSGLADIYTGQGDYWQAVKNGGHGDYRCMVLAPNSVQESVDLMIKAFDKADKYRNPVILLSDASIAQMMEPVEFPEMHIHDQDKPEWAMKGRGDGAHKRHTSVMYYNPDYDAYLKNKYDTISENEQDWEEIGTEDADLILVAYGISSRICEEVVETAREEGMKIGLIRPITLYPFPVKAFENKNPAKGYASVEISCLSQMIEDVSLASKGLPVYPIRSGMKVYEAEDVIEDVRTIMAGNAKEVY